MTSSRPAPVRRSPGRPSHDEAIQLRENLLQVALQVFLENGYAGTSMEAVARAAKMSKNTLYLQFGTKEQLFRDVAHHGLAAVRAELGSLEYGEGPIADALLAIVERLQMLAANSGLREMARLLIAESQRFPNIAGAMMEELAQLAAPLVTFLEDANRRGELRVPNPATTALDIITLAIGGIQFVLTQPRTCARQMRARAVQVRDMLMSGLVGA